MNAIETRDLTKVYLANPAVRSVNLDVPKGQVTALIGRNGAGKSTLIRMVVGLTQPTWGKAIILGCPSDALTPSHLGRIGYLAENQPVYGWMSLNQVLQLTRNTFPRFRTELFEHYRALADWGGLSNKVRNLSRGQKAQFCLAITLACDPEILILDDPTAGVDPKVRRSFLSGILEMIMTESRTVVFSTQHMGDVERIADRIALMHDGELAINQGVTEFKSGFASFVLDFRDSPNPVPDIPGIMAWTENGRQVTVSCKGDIPRIRNQLMDLDTLNMIELEQNLEDLFVVYTESLRTSKGGRGR